MFWLPAIFIFIEILTITSLDSFIRFTNCTILQKKYKDENLEKYIKKEYDGTKKLLIFISIFYIMQFVYFIVGLFHSIWMISSAFLLWTVISTIVSKLKKPTPIEKTIKGAKLKDFECDIKLQRLIKLNELNGKNVKTHEWTSYLFPLIKIIVFIAIIVLHYNFKLL